MPFFLHPHPHFLKIISSSPEGIVTMFFKFSVSIKNQVAIEREKFQDADLAEPVSSVVWDKN